ncbi:hypothetical protein [Bailinhaonella thermotolerans]|nr:hypothetical protein [Bailinhaonella thermotolerans]
MPPTGFSDQGFSDQESRYWKIRTVLEWAKFGLHIGFTVLKEWWRPRD